MGSLYAGDGGKWGEINGKFQARFEKSGRVAKSGSDQPEWNEMAEERRKLRGEALSINISLCNIGELRNGKSLSPGEDEEGGGGRE